MKRPTALALCLAATASLATSRAAAVTLSVGPGRTYATPSAAAAVARDGDVVEIAAGTYADIAIWRANNLTIRGVGGYAHLDATGMTIPNGKAIWVIQGRGYTLERIEFSGAAVRDRNGAGIRLEAPGLTVRASYFHDNENGILTGADATSDLVIENTEFARNGAGDGYSHNLYVGAVRSLTMRGCWSHNGRVGHLVKSRAAANYLVANRITDDGGTASYEIDLPNGGLAVIVGNVIEQAATTQNPAVVTFGEEGATGADQRFFFVNNTVINRRSGGTFVRVASTPTVATVRNNLFVGTATLVSGTATATTNLTAPATWFVDLARLDVRLVASAGAIDTGSDPGATPMGSAVPVAPAFEYRHPRDTAARTTAGTAIDVGAYEFTPAMGGDAGADASPDVPIDAPRDAPADVLADVAADVAVDMPTDAPADEGAGLVPLDAARADAGDDAGDGATDTSIADVARDASEESDASSSDGAAPDAPMGSDGSVVDAGAPAPSSEGCGCRATNARDARGGVAMLLIALAVVVRRQTGIVVARRRGMRA